MTVTSDKNQKTISYFQHEAEMYRAERTQIRLWYVCAFLLALLIISNAIWILCEGVR